MTADLKSVGVRLEHALCVRKSEPSIHTNVHVRMQGLQAVVDELLRLGDTKPEAEAGQEGQDQEQETTAAAAGAAAGGTDL